MVQHMVLAMIAPIFLALGAPVTLALRTLPRPAAALALAALHSRVAKVLAFPLVGVRAVRGEPVRAVLHRPLRADAEHAWLHELVHVHFIIIGCLFFWPLLGLDPLPGRWPYPAGRC